jgi:hypothetical protein
LDNRDYPQTAGPPSRLRFDDAAKSGGKAVAHASREITLTKKNIGSRAMIVWRIVGWGALLAGLSVLVRDVITWFDTRVWAPLALGQLWYDLDRSSLNLVQAVTRRYISAFLWDRVIVNVLLCWAFAALIGLGLVILLGARKRPLRHS